MCLRLRVRECDFPSYTSPLYYIISTCAPSPPTHHPPSPPLTRTRRYREVLGQVLARAGVSGEALDIGSGGMLLVLVYELLLGAGAVRGGGKVKRLVSEKLPALQDALQAELRAGGATEAQELLPLRVRQAEKLPQYLRINPLQLAAHNVSEEEVETQILQHCASACRDQHIPHLWRLPPKWPSFAQHARVADGCVVVQDKASCFPSQVCVCVCLSLCVFESVCVPLSLSHSY